MGSILTVKGRIATVDKLYTRMCLSQTVTKQYDLVLVKGRWLQAWRKVMTAYRRLKKLPCGLNLADACTPGSSLGPTLGNEYESFTLLKIDLA